MFVFQAGNMGLRQMRVGVGGEMPIDGALYISVSVMNI